MLIQINFFSYPYQYNYILLYICTMPSIDNYFERTAHCVNCFDCDKRSPLFKNLTREQMKSMEESRYEVKFEPGETIYKQGSSATHTVTLTSGLAKVYLEGKHRHIILKLLKQQDFFGGPGIYVDQRHHYTVKAVTHCTCCFMDAELFKTLVRENTDFANAYIQMVNRKAIYSFSKMLELTQKQMPGRVAGTLIYLFEEIYTSHEIKLDISRQDIAELSGMTKESAIRILKEFKDAGYITLDGQNLTIHDAENLQKIYSNG